MLDYIFSVFASPVFIPAIVVGCLVSLCSALLGVSLVLKRYSMIVAVGNNDMYVSIALSAVVLALYLIFYNRIFAVTFDESSARANGVRAGAYNILIALLSAITIVVGMRLMGTLLISGLIVFPAISSMRVFKSYRGVVISSAIISVLCFLAGFILACFDLPTGASIVIADLAVFLVFSLVGFLRKKVEKK